MDFIRQLGELALGSRMRRLTDRMAQEISVVYAEVGIDFEPRWFPVYTLLSENAPLSIVDIARSLGITHPAVNQMAGELIRKGLVTQGKCVDDKRKRLLTLTPEGIELLKILRPLWQAVELSIHEVIEESGVNFLEALEALETQMEKTPYSSRIRKHLNENPRALPEVIQITPFQPGDENAFRQLNTEWIEKYFELEAADIRMLNAPRETILNQGGHILLARYQGHTVGTCALLKVDEQTYEVAKMAVNESVQGQGIGARLLQAAIETARQAGATRVILETNSQLLVAIRMYQKFGFVEIPEMESHPTEFNRANVFMKLDLCHEAVCV